MDKTVLVLAPHTDDGEMGCGASIVKLILEGYDVVYAAFSIAEESVLPPFPPDILRYEVREATQVLGIECCHVLNFPVRRFPAFRQDILEELVKLNKKYSPQMVFLPSLSDTHQDHQVIAQEGFRAFKKTTMYGYELPWNHLDFRTSCFQVINEEHLQQKIDALQCYRSQRHRSYATEEFIRSWAITRGTQIGQSLAEAFEVIRIVHR